MSQLSIEDMIFVLTKMTSDPIKQHFDKHGMLKVLFSSLESSLKLLLKSGDLSPDQINDVLQGITKGLSEADTRHDTLRRSVFSLLRSLEEKHTTFGELALASRYKEAREKMYPHNLQINTRSYEEEVGAALQLVSLIKDDADLRNLLGNLTLFEETALEWTYGIIKAGRELQELLSKREEQLEKLAQLKSTHRKNLGSPRQALNRARQTLTLLESNLDYLVADEPALVPLRDEILAPLHQRLEELSKAARARDSRKATPADSPSSSHS
jgi:DNA repair exonuclease SbcCD ATPase subunit